MAQDPQSEFDRIFGKTQKEKSPEGNSTAGQTQKVPGDSDLLGIRTDSDRFIMKNVPESLPLEAGATVSSPLSENRKKKPESVHDAMTIALNVNVFANIADAKKSAEFGSGTSSKDRPHISVTLSESMVKSPGEPHGADADGATFVIPRSPGREDSKPGAANPHSGSSIADEFTRIINPQNIPPSPNTEFTRVLHVEESFTVPKPNFPVSGEDESVESLSITADPKLPSVSSEPQVVSKPGPSDFTKVVKGSELRSLQEKLGAGAANQAVLNPATWQPPTPTGGAHPWQSPSAPVPPYAPNPGTQWPATGQSPAMPQHPQPSKLSQYMPVIVALNVLVLLAILLIVFFAIKK
jgi:hypothetical protein